MIYMGRPEIPTNMHTMPSWGGEKKEWHLMTHAPSLLHCLCLTLSFTILYNLTMMVFSVHSHCMSVWGNPLHLLSPCFWSIVSFYCLMHTSEKVCFTGIIREKKEREKNSSFGNHFDFIATERSFKQTHLHGMKHTHFLLHGWWMPKDHTRTAFLVQV